MGRFVSGRLPAFLGTDFASFLHRGSHRGRMCGALSQGVSDQLFINDARSMHSAMHSIAELPKRKHDESSLGRAFHNEVLAEMFSRSLLVLRLRQLQR